MPFVPSSLVGRRTCRLLLLVTSLAWAATSTTTRPQVELNENSVVLITGAAGFLGSQLALALYRTYGVKKILAVDPMNAGTGTSSLEDDSSETSFLNAPQLAALEYQRQRQFHILQTMKQHVHWYRVDFRPKIPEYYDLGEVAVLDHIFREHSDISHVVHLADPFPHSAMASQAVYHETDVPKAGMMEALMEQLRILKDAEQPVPQFLYASSYEVYPHHSPNATLTTLQESQTLSTPRSLRGASKLMDEMMARFYFDSYGIPSIGLRFFSVYGPWSAPGSTLFEMAQRAVSGKTPLTSSSGDHRNIKMDFVYIDDAVDAIMTAMQYATSKPTIFNVASGQGSTLNEIDSMMKEYFPTDDDPIKEVASDAKSRETRLEPTSSPAIGSIQKVETLLGYQPQVSLHQGIVKLLAWHLDRAYPYGGYHSDHSKSQYIVNQGMVRCLPTDKECLQAAPVFPCASECSHPQQCTPSYWDVVVGWTQALTVECQNVLYTVALDPTLKEIPSSEIQVQSDSKSFLDGDTCNLAFVSESSLLVQSLSDDHASPLSSLMAADRGARQLLQHGSWTLVPIPNADPNLWHLLPKLSPGLFFAASVQKAIYVDPNILLDSVSRLLQEASMHPHHPHVSSDTALLIGKAPASKSQRDNFEFTPQKWVSAAQRVQQSAYRMVQIGLWQKQPQNQNAAPPIDSRWMVHTLQSDDARLFRCDVLDEVLQWNASNDKSAIKFILELHDVWSRVIAAEQQSSPWWVGDHVPTVLGDKLSSSRRRLEEETEEDEDIENGDEEEEEEETAPEEDDEVQMVAPVEDDNAPDGFDAKGDQVAEIVAGEQEQRGDSSEQGDDEVLSNEGEGDDEEIQKPKTEDRDYSSYDTWMGVLSAGSIKYFARIVPSVEVGVVALDH